MASSVQRLIIIGAASVTLAAAGVLPSYALAATSNYRRFGEGRFGTVAGVGDASITLATKGGTTLTVDTAGARIVKAGNDASLSAVSVGDPVAVFGTAEASGALEADIVVDTPVRRARYGGIIGGTVESVAAGAFSLVPKTNPGKSARPPVTVDTDTATVITKGGQPVPFTALTAGTSAIVSGTEAQNGLFLASKIIIRGR